MAATQLIDDPSHTESTNVIHIEITFAIFAVAVALLKRLMILHTCLSLQRTTQGGRGAA